MNLDVIEKRIPSSILKSAIPAIAAMIIMSMVSIVDGFFIGNYLGKSSLAAVNLGLPILYIFLGVGLMTGVGGAIQSIRALGSQEFEQANNGFNQTLASVLISLAGLSLCFSFFLEPLSHLFDVDNTVKTEFLNYYCWMVFAYPFSILNVIYGIFARAEGKPILAFNLSLLSLLLNVILNYLFVAVFNAGIAGIAIASIIAVLLCQCFGIAYFKFKSKHFGFARFDFQRVFCANMLKNGSSEFIAQISLCFTIAALNAAIIKVNGVTGVAAMTVVSYTSMIFSMIVIGFNQGVGPLIGLSMGAKRFELAKKLRNTTILYVVGLGAALWLSLSIFHQDYGQLFVDNSEVNALISKGLPIYALAFLFLGFNMTSTNYFTARGKAKQSAFIASLRSLVVLMPCIIVLPSLFGMDGVWLIAPTTELITMLASIYLLVMHDKVALDTVPSTNKA